MKTIRCAGLTLNGACTKQTQCAHHANWWQVSGVQFNACSDTKALKHFTPIRRSEMTPPKIIQQELFA